MPKLRFFIAFLGITAAGAAHSDGFTLAEFRADQGFRHAENPYSAAAASPEGLLARNPVGSVGSDWGRDVDRSLYYPANLYGRELRGSQQRSWSMGDYKLSGVMDWGYRSNYLAGEHYGDESFVSLGSRFSFGENDETYLYYGLDRDQLGEASHYSGGFGDSETRRTGLSETLYFGEQRAQVGVGYEYASGDRDLLYQGLEGHEVNVSGRVRIGWGFNAHLEAGYGLYSYSEYDGVRGDLNSARTNMRAGISRSFTPSLSWGLHYTYTDEEFDVSELSQSSRTWGLSLEYRY